MLNTTSLRTILPLAVLLVSSACSAPGETANSLVLTADSIGRMRLSRDSIISVGYLKKAFPEYRVTHEIRSGDSPDYHYFEIATAEDEVLFTIVSFLKEGRKRNLDGNLEAVPIDLLKVVSRRVTDKFGIRVGDRVADIVRAQGENLHFGAGHFDVYLGGDQIFYNMQTGSIWSPEKFTFADAKRENWEIVSISWPTGAWE